MTKHTKAGRRRKRSHAGRLAPAAARVRSAFRNNGLGVPAWCVGALGLCALAAVVHATTDEALMAPKASQGSREVLLGVLERESERAPADAAPALKRAYADWRQAGSLDAAAAEALRRSYVLEPLGPDATPWRLQFIFNNWSSAPPDVRQLALRELETAFPRHGWALRHLPLQVSDASGRMVAILTFQRLRAEQKRSEALPVSR